MSARQLAEYRLALRVPAYVRQGHRRVKTPKHSGDGSNWQGSRNPEHAARRDCVFTGSGGCTRACDSHCLLCDGSGTLPDDLMDAAVRVLNKDYADVPPGVDPEDWEVERIKLLYSASAYRWYYADDPLETIVREHHFKVAVPNPFAKNNSTLRQLTLGGIIDKIVRRTYNYVVDTITGAR